MQKKHNSNSLIFSTHAKRLFFALSCLFLTLATYVWASHSPLIIFSAIKLASVVILAFALFKIEKQAVPISMMYGVLSFLLLLITFAPFSLNIAEATSYGLEFIVFFISIICVARAKLAANNMFFWLAMLLTALIFYANLALIPLLFGAAFLIMVTYSLWQNWQIVKMSLKWLFINTVGLLIMLIANAVTKQLFSRNDFFVPNRLFSILDSIGSLGIQTTRDSIINSGFRFTSATTIVLIASIVFIIIGSAMTALFVRATLITKPPKKHKLPTAPLVSIMLIATAVAAIISCALGNQIAVYIFFAVLASIYAVIFASLTYTKVTTVSIPRLVILSVFSSMLIVGCLFAISDTAMHTRNDRLSAYGSRDNDIADALRNHRASYLISDYWRVLPLSTKIRNQGITLTSSDSCNQYSAKLALEPRPVPESNASFAYILTLDNEAKKECRLTSIEKLYGQPSSSLIIAGTPNNPQELLLFYDKGKNSSVSKIPQSTPRAPKSIEAEVSPACQNKTIMVSVAHEDDDLLFINPDINHKIAEGFCVRTVFLTAGDNGAGKFHWLRRKQGSEVAYGTMLGDPGIEWTEKTVQIDKTEFLTIASPKDNPNISLIFLNAPDGNLVGQGFGSSANQSLENLWNNKIPNIRTVDGQSTYNAGELSNTLAVLMQTYHPLEIWTQSYSEGIGSDHSDHLFAGMFTKKAYDRYISQFGAEQTMPPIKFYIGYPIRAKSENLSLDDSLKKKNVFENYAKYDMTICRDKLKCVKVGTYEAYLFRQYTDGQE